LGLQERFRIERPLFNYDTLQFDLEYVVSDFMGDNFVEYQVYENLLCGRNDETTINNTFVNSTVITDNDYLLSRLRPDLSSVGDGDGNRTMKVTLNIDQEMISTSPIFEDFETYATVSFCVRLGVYNMDTLSPDALEVNFLETPVLLTILLVDTFEIDVGQLSNQDLVVEMAYEDSAVIGYICDSESNTVEGDVGSQGESIRICVTPTDQTLSEGAFLRYLDEFTFRRGEHFQVAIEAGTGGSPASQLTVISCTPGSLICAFETLLGAEFFEGGIGVVYGEGTAFLQFGEGEGETRRLQVTADVGNDQLLAERPTAFKFEIVALPVDYKFAARSAAATMPLTVLGIFAFMTISLSL
jgi:hypothetical protein